MSEKGGFLVYQKTVCVIIDAEDLSSLGGVIHNVICGYSSFNKYVNGYSLVCHVILLHRLLQKVLLPLQTMIDWSVTFFSLHCSDLAS